MTEKMYFDEPLRLEFEAAIADVRPQDGNLLHVIIDQTYFYPTGGGQSHDIGWLAEFPVVDVFMDGEQVIHVVQGGDFPSKGHIEAKVDEVRRWRNMQAHTGQHLLSASFVQVLAAETLAVKMNPDAPSTVDVARADLTPEQIEEVEMVTNQIIFENRPVYSHFYAPDDPKLGELRRAVKFDKVQGAVRVVEIDGWDLSACAGTHVPHTGMLGLLKILKTENYKGGSRVHFAVGYEALAQFRHMHQVAVDTSNLLSSSISDVVGLVQKLQEERQSLTKELAQKETALLAFEKDQLLAESRQIGDVRFISVGFVDRPNSELKTLANLISAEPQTILVLANQQGENAGVIIAASEDSGVHAGNLLRETLSAFDGRGGGSASYAQGQCKNLSDIDALFQDVQKRL